MKYTYTGRIDKTNGKAIFVSEDNANYVWDNNNFKFVGYDRNSFVNEDINSQLKKLNLI